MAILFTKLSLSEVDFDEDEARVRVSELQRETVTSLPHWGKVSPNGDG
jgi:hypothetical protein